MKVLRNNEVNSIITYLFTLITLYFAFAAVLGQPVFDPLHEPDSHSEENDSKTVFLAFFLVNIAVVSSWISSICRLPTLFGPLLMGIVIRTIPALNSLFILPPYWDLILRKLAFVNIIVRWGLGINARFIANNRAFPIALGLTALAEALVLTVAAWLLLGLSFTMASLCGLAVATVSPAITVPSMIKFREGNIGIKKRIPDNVLAACLSPKITILYNLLSLVLATAVGVLAGVILWYFPSNSFSNMQFSRSLLLGSLCTAVIMGSIKLKYPCAGMLCGVLICCVAPLRWREDNEKKAIPVETTFRILWDFFSLPILFILLGMKLDGELLSAKIVGISVGIILIGLLARVALVFLAASFFPFNHKDRLLMGFAMLPRATLQADLGPTLVTMAHLVPPYLPEANTVLQVCIISVLLTAPVMDFIIALTGPRLLAELPVYEAQEREDVVEQLESKKDMTESEKQTPTAETISSV
ncbi:unnamed protein product [Caenorhabditis auriculariae]|uniref:Cation/H+ exchanger transmembrane domain-containing protein n=1 Tax=Caenorhabditis auriculariae TaxID=2777116 RepID=A0A8S1GTN1_9PELO|nr:unnamed protein product [Caenorhabditis auriculariae]